MEKEGFTAIIFGGTGDLSRRKLIPAFYNLYKKKKISNLVVIGVGRKKFDNKKYAGFVKPKIADKKMWNNFVKKLYYFRTEFHDKEGYKELSEFIKETEKKYKIKNRLFYLATLPDYFELISNNMYKYKLHRAKGWHRVIFEKPFGNNLKSAKKINKCVRKLFKEKQSYRIDHYLGKELVQNILVVRFANLVLEPLWNNKGVDHVQINLVENLDTEGRGEFYDKYGALKDVVQNHLLQLLCLVTMEVPSYFDAKHVRDEKVKILKAVKKIKKENVIIGQYENYTKEKGVGKNSKTETFAVLKLYLDNEKWKNVPFYIRTGKGMHDKFSSIYVQFKESPCILFNTKTCNLKPNYLYIRIHPNEGISLQVNTKALGGKLDINPELLDFCHSCIYGINTPEAYENLILDCINGDQTVFMRNDEIEESWKIIDHIKRLKLKLYKYKKGSKGPKEAIDFIRKEGRDWFDKTRGA